MRVDLEKIFGKQDNESYTTVDPKSVLVLEEMRSRYGGETSIETILSKLKGNKIHRCPKCHGKGKIVSDPCPDCKGKGSKEVEKTLTIKVPKG